MLGINLVSETFQKLLFNTQPYTLSSKMVTSTVKVSQMIQKSKKNTIIIISNGIQQKQSRPRRKKYVFSDEQLQESQSEIISQTVPKKHLIKKQKKQDPDYSVKRQKNDRNVVSNIIHHLMKHILTSVPKSSLDKIIQKIQFRIKSEQFLQILQDKDKLCRTYITNKHLKLIWNDLQRSEYSKLMRILSRIFLENYSFLTIFNGNKLNKESKALHYKGRRQLLQFLQKIK